MTYGTGIASRVPHLPIVIGIWTVLLLMVLTAPSHTGLVLSLKSRVGELFSGRSASLQIYHKHRSVTSPTRSSANRHGRPGIRIGTFLYMGIATQNPSPAQLARSCFPKSMAVTLTFKTSPTATAPSGKCRFKGIYYPKSTWTTARNKLLSVAFDLEEEQDWKFEFFVFVDDDVKLILSGKPPGVFVDGEAHLQRLLLRDRPLRTSVQFGVVPLFRAAGLLSCARACYSDAALDAYHRSGVELFLPYNPALDATSWYMSAYIVNLQTAAAAQKYCSIYREITVDGRLTTRANYPKGSNQGMDSGAEWKEARAMVARQLQKHKVPGFEGGVTDEGMRTKLYGGLFGSDQEHCTAQPVGVNYTRLVPKTFLHGQ